MADYTVKVKGLCAGGGHVFLDVLRDGIVIKSMTLPTTDFLESNLNWEEVIVYFIRQTIKRSKATTLAQAKSAIESASWEF